MPALIRRNRVAPARRSISADALRSEVAMSHAAPRSNPTPAQSMSPAEVRRRTNRFANVLRSVLGLGKGDRLFILCDRAPEVHIGTAGALKAGLEVRPLQPNMEADQLKLYLETGKANAVLTTREIFESKVEDSVPAIATLHHILIAGEPLEALMRSVPDEFVAEPG
jgi:acyl-CoA synthetase (AMP-forming)/AMP-acid ligase II